MLTTSDRAVYEAAMTVGHHPFRLAAELTDPRLLPLAPAAASYKYRIPALSAVIATEQLKRLPDRMSASERNLDHLAHLIQARDVPLRPLPLPEHSVRGWYGAPFTLPEPVADPTAVTTACKQAGLPVRALYTDWLSTPLLQEPALIERYWPHMRGRWNPPDARDFPNYQRFRAQTLLLKIPDIPAPGYIEQVAAALTIIARFLRFPERSTMTARVGICGTDLHFAAGRFPYPLPTVLGHEASGTVEQTGTGVTSVRAGDRVLVCDQIPCGQCGNCLSGRMVYCTDASTKQRQKIRLSLDGQMFRQYLAVSALADRMLVDAAAGPQEVADPRRRLDRPGQLGAEAHGLRWPHRARGRTAGIPPSMPPTRRTSTCSPQPTSGCGMRSRKRARAPRQPR